MRLYPMDMYPAGGGIHHDEGCSGAGASFTSRVGYPHWPTVGVGLQGMERFGLVGKSVLSVHLKGVVLETTDSWHEPAPSASTGRIILPP